MKKLTFKLLALVMVITQSAIFTACSDDDDDAVKVPQISMSRPAYNLATGSIEVSIKASCAPAADITIPVTVQGTATDYTLGSQAFILKKGETIASITVTRKEGTLPEDIATITLNLQEGTGYTLGLTNYSEITLLGSNGYIYSFLASSARLQEEDTYTIQLSTMKGSNYKPAAGESFEIEVDEDLSTAVEGVNFSFPEGKTINVKPNAYKGTFSVKYLASDPKHNILVIRIADKAGFAPGTNATMTIEIAGPDDLTGTWAYKGIASTTIFEMYGSDTSKMPTGTSSETMTFVRNNDGNYTFNTTFTGDFKNYFGTASRTATNAGIVSKDFQEMDPNCHDIKMTNLVIPDINVKFSANAQELKATNVYFRLTTVDNVETLECLIDEYAPLSNEFGGDIYDIMGDMLYAPLRVYFTRK